MLLRGNMTSSKADRLAMKTKQRPKLTITDHLALAFELYAIRERLAEINCVSLAGLPVGCKARKTLVTLERLIDRVRFNLAETTPYGLDIYQNQTGRDVGERLAKTIRTSARMAATLELETA